MNSDSPFELSMTDVPEGSLRVVSFHGRERMSRPYAWDITVASRELDERAMGRAVLGRPVRLVIHGGEGDRVVRGVVARASSAGKHLHDRVAWRLRVVPRLRTLEHRRNSRIFQDMTAPDIVGAVLGEAGVPFRRETEQEYTSRSYCVQYEETDLDFVHRVLAEVGIFYRFEHAGVDFPVDEPEVVVFGDRPRYQPIAGNARLVHRVQQPGGALRTEEHHVTSFVRRAASGPVRYARRDHDFQRPLAVLEASSDGGDRGAGRSRSPAEVYEHHGELAEIEAEQRLEATALEQLRRSTDVAAGRSHCPRLLPGRRFTLDEHEIASHDGDYVVTALDHEGRSPEITGGAEPIYENRLRAVPATTVFRPARRARQFVQVMETAVVVGPAGQEIHTDAHGRVKVQFHWDREGKRDERSSCWIRVVQAWAGSGWGFQFVPRVGMEVLVAFLGGDPDRPMVVGCVPDATHPPPYPLPENQTTSGIRTETTPGGGGFNEILFDDERGGELVSIRAERNLTETALNDHLQSVGHDQTVSVAGKRSTEVGGDDTLRVAGGQTWTVQGPQRLSVEGGASSTCSGARSTAIAGDDTTRIGGGQTILASAYSHLLIGQGVPEGHGLVHVNGNYHIGAAAAVQVGAMAGITLSCGDSSIELTPGEIKIRSPKVTIVAAEELLARGKEHEVAVTDHLEIRGQDIRLFAKEGQLLLDDDARLDGKRVRLGSGGPGPEKKEVSEEDERGTIKFRVKPHFEVGPGDRLVAVIATPTGEVVEAELDASMEVELEGKKGDRFVLVDLRKGELPFGKRGV